MLILGARIHQVSQTAERVQELLQLLSMRMFTAVLCEPFLTFLKCLVLPFCSESVFVCCFFIYIYGYNQLQIEDDAYWL